MAEEPAVSEVSPAIILVEAAAAIPPMSVQAAVGKAAAPDLALVLPAAAWLA